MACFYWFIGTSGEKLYDVDVYEGCNDYVDEIEDKYKSFCFKREQHNFWVPPEEMLDRSNWEQYFFSFFWAITVVTGIGRDVTPVSKGQHIYSSIVILFGVFL